MQIGLAISIDRRAQERLASSQGGEAFLASLYDYMGIFKQLLDTCSPDDMDLLCQQYGGRRFAVLLGNLAQGIADGTIAMPEL